MRKTTARAPAAKPTLEIPILVNPSPADRLATPYARVSLPFPKGMFATAPAVRIRSEAGVEAPVQTEPLANWPDGSARALHATFPASGGVYRATVGGSGRPAAPAHPIRVTRRRDGRIEVTTGRLAAVVGGPGLVESIRLGGAEFVGPNGIEVRVVDGHGRAFVATADAKPRTTVELEGPLRTVVAVSGIGTLEDSRFIDFRLRFEFLAGAEGFSIAYTFFNLERGRDFVDVQAIELDLRLADAMEPGHSVYQQSYGLFSTLGRLVTTPQPFDIALDDSRGGAYVRNYAALGDDHDYPFYLNPPADRIDSWAALSDGARCMLAEMDDFTCLRPKSLQLDGDVIRFGIWPRWAAGLSLQQGRSRQVTVRVALSDRGAPADAAAVGAAIAQLRDTLRAQLRQSAYAQASFFDQGRVLPRRPDLNPRFEQWIGGMSAALNTFATFFDLGDTPDSGYQSTYIPGNRIRRVRGEESGPRYYLAAVHHQATKHNALDDFEVVWVNNEYDALYALGTEALRAGDLSLFRKMRWWARHTIDVDFLHYSDHRWLHRATPAHSERHTTTGAYPSHFWTQGLAQYYMLTADPDALEVIVALADKTIENLDDPVIGPLNSGLNREIGWGILTMICAYEASGLARFDAYARELIDRQIDYGLPGDIPVFSFGHTSILLGAREYLEIHKGEPEAEAVRRWFLEFVDLAIRSSRGAPPAAKAAGAKSPGYSYGAELAARGLFHAAQPRSGIFSTQSIALDPLAYAYEITGNRAYVEAGMRSVEALLDSPDYRNPVPEAKPYAKVYRTFINFLKPASELGYLKSFDYRY